MDIPINWGKQVRVEGEKPRRGWGNRQLVRGPEAGVGSYTLGGRQAARQQREKKQEKMASRLSQAIGSRADLFAREASERAEGG